MLKNYLKVAIRNLIKNKSNTFINIGGLTLGVVCALVIFLVIQYDLSFDTWHPDSERTHRIVRIDTDYGTTDYSRGGPYPLASAVETDISGIQNVTIIFNNFSNTPVISYSEDGIVQNKFKEEGLVFVEQDYFEIFSSIWIQGNKSSALLNPNTVVVSKSFAEKMFRDSDVLGKFVTVNFDGNNIDLEITGIIEDAPNNSDFPFTLIGSVHSKTRSGLPLGNDDSWSSSSSSIQTYVKLEPAITAEQINNQFDGLISKYQDAETAEILDYRLQPLSDIHFNSLYDNYNNRTVEKRVLFTLALIGIFLLVTACINFINLNTAVAVSRSKEVGLRKTLGSTKTQLTIHFLGETAFITLIALILGLGLSEIVLKQAESIFGFSLSLNLLSNIELMAFVGFLFVAITLAAGWYPANYLSGFSPIDAIRNRITASFGKGITLRRSLIVLQFTITQVLIIGTIVISSQIKYFQSQDLGFNREAIIEIALPSNEKQTLNTLKNSLLNESSILNVTFSNTGTTSNSTWSGNYLLIDDTVQHRNNAQVKFVDEDFVETYGLTILAGEGLTPSDTVNKYLVNEAFARQVGYGDNYEGLLDKPHIFWGKEAPITGIVKDFNTQSLHSQVEPVVLTTRRVYYLGGIRINMAHPETSIAAIERIYDEIFPESVFEYDFLDEQIASMYEEEQQAASIMNAFTLIAILIGSLGLFGLVSYMATTRTKEIGVRKVLGASIADILKIFARELGILTGISFLIASPIAWFMMQKWLEDFAYKIELGIGIFVISLLGTVVLATLTVGYKSILAALANPVDSLKSE